jgi:protein-disulfide isomerase
MQGASPEKWEAPVMFARREFLTAGGIFLLTAAGRAAPLQFITAAEAQTAPPKDAAKLLNEVADLLRPRPEDVVLGSDKAPVTIVEYASMTCPHCAHFSETTFKELKRRYIDTGKVLFIFREFPLDRLGAAGFMLARCAGKDKYMALVEALFAKQRDWLVNEPMAPLKAIAKKFGFTDRSFAQCLANQEALESLNTARDSAAQKLGIDATPTFFVNGKKLVGDQSIEVLAKEIDPYLKE